MYGFGWTSDRKENQEAKVKGRQGPKKVPRVEHRAGQVMILAFCHLPFAC